jgi:hypothetical protein
MTHVKTALIALLAIAVIGMGLLALSAGLPVWAWLLSFAPASAALVITVADWLLSLGDPAGTGTMPSPLLSW